MKEEWKKESTSLLQDMKAIAAQMRQLVVSMPPRCLLGYIHVKYWLKRWQTKVPTKSVSTGCFAKTCAISIYFPTLMRSEKQPIGR